VGLAGWRPTPEQGAWTVLAVATAVFVTLAAASSANYASVVVAHTISYMVPRFAISYDQTAPSGALTLNSSINASFSLRVENPSSRTLRFFFVAYSAWIEDWPARDGYNATRRTTDKAFVNGSQTAYFFQVVAESRNIPQDPVPAHGNATVSLSFRLTRATDPSRFDVVRNITDEGVSRNGSADAVPWNHWVRLDLLIEGVPEPSNLEAGYLRDLRRIELQWGLNLGF